MTRSIIALIMLLIPSLVCARITNQIVSDEKFGSNPGNLSMSYITQQNSQDLVVILHGCTQNAIRYANGSGWTALAKQHQFDLLLPSQKSENNLKTCFNWYQQQDISHDQGELLSIIEMIGHLKSSHQYDNVYVTGVSAGAAMAMALIANYPQQFSGAGLIAGISYQCGIGLFPALQCMKNGSGANVEQLRQRLSPNITLSALPKLSLWHGASDTIVNPKNSIEMAKQWLSLFPGDRIHRKSIKKTNIWQQIQYQTADNVIVEHNVISELGHSQSVDHDNIATGDYLTNNGISTARDLARFFGLLKSK